jgi:hypothetical protein
MWLPSCSMRIAVREPLPGGAAYIITLTRQVSCRGEWWQSRATADRVTCSMPDFIAGNVGLRTRLFGQSLQSSQIPRNSILLIPVKANWTNQWMMMQRKWGGNQSAVAQQGMRE